MTFKIISKQQTFDYIKKLVEEEDAAAQQEQQNQKENRQPKEDKKLSAAAASGAGAPVDVDRHDLCDNVCDEDLEKYRDARLEELFC